MVPPTAGFLVNTSKFWNLGNLEVFKETWSLCTRGFCLGWFLAFENAEGELPRVRVSKIRQDISSGLNCLPLTQTLTSKTSFFHMKLTGMNSYQKITPYKKLEDKTQDALDEPLLPQWPRRHHVYRCCIYPDSFPLCLVDVQSCFHSHVLRDFTLWSQLSTLSTLAYTALC